MWDSADTSEDDVYPKEKVEKLLLRSLPVLLVFRKYSNEMKSVWTLLFVLLLALQMSHVCSYTGTVNVGSAGTNSVSPGMFGINSPWQNFGDGIVKSGQWIMDKSFSRDVDNSGVWFNNFGAGQVLPQISGCVPLTEDSSCVQILNPVNAATVILGAPLSGPIRAGYTYNVSFQAKPASTFSYVYVALSTRSYSPGGTVLIPFPVSPPSSAWHFVSASISSSLDIEDPIMYFYGLNGTGEVWFDEVSLTTNGENVEIDANALSLIDSLGIQALRYPGGFLVDMFKWKKSIGPLYERKELRMDSGFWPQTPSFGLDEFLTLCETKNLIPYLQINVLESPSDVSDLMEYVYGDGATTWGMLRSANGHPAPYNVTYFEMGNEPNEIYNVQGNKNNTGADYANLTKLCLAKLTSSPYWNEGMMITAAATESQFTLADWFRHTPPLSLDIAMLQNWNPQVWENETTSVTAEIKGASAHYYSYHGISNTDSDLVAEALSGGSLIRDIALNISSDTTGKELYVSEYGITISNNSIVVASYLCSYLAGLVVADELLSMIDSPSVFTQAYYWNFGQDVGFGVVARNASSLGLYQRPTGLIFEMMRPLATLDLVKKNRSLTDFSASTTVGPMISVGAVPGGYSYDGLGVYTFTTRDSKIHYVYLLNRDYSKSADLTIKLQLSKGWKISTVESTVYSNGDIRANNEDPMNLSVELSVFNLTDTAVNAERNSVDVSLNVHSLTRLKIAVKYTAPSHSSSQQRSSSFHSTLSSSSIGGGSKSSALSNVEMSCVSLLIFMIMLFI